jgi:hypothetical protein
VGNLRGLLGKSFWEGRGGDGVVIEVEPVMEFVEQNKVGGGEDRGGGGK